ncbi:MAG: DUF488 domain-containing protein [Thermoproteus sp.]
MIKTKRVYEEPSLDDGVRVLVDRLWPRGLSREQAKVDYWLKEVAPSDELRRWFGHDPEKWEEFKERYWRELDAKRDVVERLVEIIKTSGTVTLLYAARDPDRNNAVALREYLKARYGL